MTTDKRQRAVKIRDALTEYSAWDRATERRAEKQARNQV